MRGLAALTSAREQGPAEGGERQRHARVKDGAPAERADQDARDRGAGREPEADRRIEGTEPAAAEGRRCAERGERRRGPIHEPARDPLHRAPGQEEAEGRREAAQGEPGDREDQAGAEHGQVTDAVGRRAGDERHHGVAACVADDHPAYLLGRRVEGRGDRGEGDVDHRVERHDERAGCRD